MPMVNSKLYNYLYNDVRVSGILPKTHYQKYGEKEKRFANIRRYKLENRKISLSVLFEISLLYIYVCVMESSLTNLATLIRRILINLEIRFIKDLGVETIIFNSWVKGGTFEVSNLYASKLSKDNKILVTRTFKDMLGLNSNPMTFEVWCNGKIAHIYNSFFSIETINEILFENPRRIKLYVNHVIDYELNFQKLDFTLFSEIIYIVNDYYLFNSKWNLFDTLAPSNLRQLGVGTRDDFSKRLTQLGLSDFFNSIDKFIVPSLDTYNRIFELLSPKQIIISYHFEKSNLENIPVTINNSPKTHKNVLLLGDAGAYKGGRELELLLAHFRNSNDFFFHHFGSENGKFKISNYLNYGIYNRINLIEDVNKLNIDFAFLPFQCYETYSFTLSDVFVLELPLITTDIGAITERCFARPYTILLQPNPSLTQILEAVENIDKSSNPYFNASLGIEYSNLLFTLRERKDQYNY
jgi:hypothetical protein